MELDRVYEPLPAPVLKINQPGWLDRLARLISIVGSPPAVALLGIALVAGLTRDAATWLWASGYVLLVLTAPLAYVVWKVQRGEISDLDLFVREQRLKPYLITVASSVCALAVIYFGQAPRLLFILAAAIGLLILLLFVVTLWWKISIHCAAAALFVTLTLGLLGSSAVLIMLGLPLVVWSRVRLHRHTILQALFGSGLGVVISIVALALYRQG
jgi:membrane-associated phospholipid phosphatase